MRAGRDVFLSMPLPGLRGLLALALLLYAGGCVWIFHRVDVEALEAPSDPITVRSPVKAHLLDGSTVVYSNGLVIAQDTLRGQGTRYDLALRDSASVDLVPLDSVVAMETFQRKVNVAPTLLVSTLTTAATPFLVGAAYVAIFGSCPTFYSDSAGTFVREAESFSYSIAPLYEKRDVDRLRVGEDGHGWVRLEVRNEALETHYLNHLELLEVRHAADELALPDERGRPLAVRNFLALTSIVDRLQRDLAPTLAAADDDVFRTDGRVLEAVGPDDLEDHIDLVLPAPEGIDTAALVLRLRNSLLVTVLLYDLMLGDRGARALDWLGHDLQRIGPAVELGLWYGERMGLGVAVWDKGRYREVARVRDTGPIAWKDLAVLIPVPAGDSLRVRLSFVADNWRIDRVAIAANARRPASRRIALAEAVGSDSAPDTAALASLRAADERYLQTSPGQRFTAAFDVGPPPPPAGPARTFFLAAQGYYVEWIRRRWVESGREATAFRPSDAALLDAMKRWRSEQASFEGRFEATRIPVR